MRSGLFAMAFVGAAATLLGSPTIDSTVAMPFGIATNLPTVVTILAKISDPSVIPNSVNLLRLNAAGAQPSILGSFHDDGQAGDLVAGDQVYTLQVTFSEVAAGQIQLQVSAAFRGELRRALSGLLTVNVTVAANLPPDPGSAGMTTIQGIDSDQDGVRDDVQRYIALTHPASAKTRAALTQITKAVQSLLLDSANQQNAIADILAVGQAMECSMYIHGTATASPLANNLFSQILNTPQRASAYFAADAQFGGQVYKLTPSSQQAALCSFNPLILPN